MTMRPILHDCHPKVTEAFELMRGGQMDRRSFIRIAALLGVSATAAYSLAGLSAPATAAGNLPFPAADKTAKSGGTLRIAMQVQPMVDPAGYDWVEVSNQTRHTLEHLAMTGPDNITRPMLAESWEASDDLKTWTFKLRRGIKWHNGDDFIADHVKFNVQRWLDPELRSSNRGLATFAAMLKKGNKKDKNGKRVMVGRDNAVEVIDEHTIRFNLAKPVLSVPEDCYNYPTALVHPSFKAPLSENMIGTGPFALAELEVGKKCLLRRVTKMTNGEAFTYWGGDIFLDEIHYLNHDEEGQLTAFASGEVDTIYEFGIDQMELARVLDGEIQSARTAQALCCRMQITQKPFDDIRVRKAITLAIDNKRIKDFVYPESGDMGENTHVAPIHPEYFQLPPLKRDVAKAKELLKQAGYENGLTLTIDVGNTDGTWHQTVCESMRDQLRDAGITLNLNVIAPEKYWEIWDKTAFGATAWTHRPLGTMVLSLGYRSGVPWNETKFSSAEFDAALDAAEATFDVDERRAKMEKVQKILQDAAVIIQPIFRPVHTIVAKKVRGYRAHPTQYHQLNRVWLE